LRFRSRGYIDSLKRGDATNIQQNAGRAHQLSQAGTFPAFFGNDVTLVPVPGSAPRVKGGLWVPHMIAKALKDVGLARDVAPILTRVKAVAKSAYSAPADRPNVQTHFDSFAVDVVKPPPPKILLVDDVVTQGCTMLAAARRILAAYPNAEIRAFALFRPMGNVEIEKMIEPCVGTIQPRNDRAVRRP
jgi:predicted amidophosphoribosyltransferase